MMKEVMEGKMESTRRPGRTRIGLAMIDELMDELKEKGRGPTRMESLATSDLPCGRTLKKNIMDRLNSTAK